MWFICKFDQHGTSYQVKLNKVIIGIGIPHLELILSLSLICSNSDLTVKVLIQLGFGFAS